MNGSFWLILAVIGAAAVCRILYLIFHQSDQTSGGGSGTGTPAAAGSGSGARTEEMVYFADNPHRRQDCEYRFSYQYLYDSRVGGMTWRALILRMPSLCGRAGDSLSTHRWFGTGGQSWICWNSPIDTLKGMQDVSRVWANNVQEYIATGKKFG